MICISILWITHAVSKHQQFYLKHICWQSIAADIPGQLQYTVIYHINIQVRSSYESVPEQLVSVPEQLVSVPEQFLVFRNSYKSYVAVISLPEQL